MELFLAPTYCVVQVNHAAAVQQAGTRRVIFESPSHNAKHLDMHEAAVSCTSVREEKCLHVQVVDFQGWQSIDAAEVAAGQGASKPREKFVDTQDMIRLGAGM